MQRALVLGAEAQAARHLLHLLLAVPVQPHLRADGAGVAARAFQVEADPAVVGQDGVLIKKQRPFWLATRTSSAPSLLKSARATARPS